MDAIEVAGRFGIGADRAVNYECDRVGTALNYQVLSETVSQLEEQKRNCRDDDSLLRTDQGGLQEAA